MRADVTADGIISPVLFSLYVNDMPSPFQPVELALYADDTTIITTSRQAALLVNYLELYMVAERMEHCRQRLEEHPMLFAKAGRRIPKPGPVQCFVKLIYWVYTTPYQWVTLDTRLI
jgi:hypothetical protein